MDKFTLRTHRPGDMGWIIHRKAVLSAAEYGWNENFEALVAEITASFIRGFNPDKERCWIAERDGCIVGSVFLVQESERVGRLRLLYVEPEARGLGIGASLVETCIVYARGVGYQTLVLGTQHVLLAARHLYAKVGFVKTQEAAHCSYGSPLIAENWELCL